MEKIIRPWGHFVVLYKNEKFLIKKLVVKPNSRLSLQYHNFRDEYWIVLDGKGEAIIGERIVELKKGDFIKVPRKTTHRIINNSALDLVILEVWVGKKLDENDIVRLQDDYGRI